MGFLTDYIRSEQKNHNPHFVMDSEQNKYYYKTSVMKGIDLWGP